MKDIKSSEMSGRKCPRANVDGLWLIFVRLILQDKPIKLIYAYGDTDEIEYHSTHRGTKEVNLLNYMPRVTPQHRDYIDVTMDNVSKFILYISEVHFLTIVTKNRNS